MKPSKLLNALRYIYVFRKVIIYCFIVILLLWLASHIEETYAVENATDRISFVEIMPNPDGTDTKENEYLKLQNESSSNTTLENWKVCNISNDCYLLKESIEAGSCLKIFRSSFIFTLHNDKEELTLFDPTGSTIDKISTGSAPSGKAWQCYQGNCAWGSPQESCDYSFLLPSEEEPQTNDNSLNPEDEISNENTNLQENNTQSNNNSASTQKNVTKPVLNILKSKDLTKIQKKMRKEKLTSALVNIAGIVSLPQGLMGKTIFYLSFGDNLIKTHVYSSCQNSPLCLRDLNIKIGDEYRIMNTTLKIIDNRWELYLDKNSVVEVINKKKLEKAKINKNLKNKAGKIVTVRGKILSKKGDYFFISDPKNQDVISVYLPKMLQYSFLQQLDNNLLGYFPFYYETQPSKLWIGGELSAKGVVETAEGEYRIIGSEIIELKGKPESAKNANDSLKDQKDNRNNNSNRAIEIPFQESENKDTNQTINQSNNNENIITGAEKYKIKQVLVDNLSWKALLDIIFSKLFVRINAFKQYF